MITQNQNKPYRWAEYRNNKVTAQFAAWLFCLMVSLHQHLMALWLPAVSVRGIDIFIVLQSRSTA